MTYTPTVTNTPTETMTPTVTPTPTFTSPYTPTPSATVCGDQTIQIFDERGEKVASLCGNIPFSEGTSFTMSLSPFTLNPSGTGGQITIYLNGQPAAVWNGFADNGIPVPNGFYHFLLVEHAPGGNTVTLARDAYIGPSLIHELVFTARPNLVRSYEPVQITVSFAGIPADSQSTIKIYDLSGEWVNELSVSHGAAVWDSRNKNGNRVSSGLYLLVLEGIQPSTHEKLNKCIKLMISR